MSLLNLGPRSVLCVTLPGAILVLAFMHGVLSIPNAASWQSNVVELAAKFTTWPNLGHHTFSR